MRHRYGDRVIARGGGPNPGRHAGADQVRAPRLEPRARHHAASVSAPAAAAMEKERPSPAGKRSLAYAGLTYTDTAVWSPGCGGGGGELGGREGAPWHGVDGVSFTVRPVGISFTVRVKVSGAVRSKLCGHDSTR
jgi:hypothetical protein